MSRTALLVPEPKNEYDPNAVAVVVEGLHVGYLAREHAAKLSRSLRASIADGIQPAVAARIWAIPDDGTWRARVTLELSGASGDDRDFGQEEAEQKARVARAAKAQDVGKVRGKPFMWWRGDVADLKRDGRNDDALILLLECVDAAERVAQVEGGAPQQWPTEQAAIVYRKLKDPIGEVAILQRYQAASPEGEFSPKLGERLHNAQRLMALASRFHGVAGSGGGRSDGVVWV